MRKLRNEELNRLSVSEFHLAEKQPVLIILDNIRSLNNIGSIFRTADSFRIDGIYLCGITAKPPHREINKTALGATESVMWKYFDSTDSAVKTAMDNGYKIVVIEQVEDCIMLQNFSPEINQKYAFIFGNEINGVSDNVIDLADYIVEIPQFGTKHSFNVSISAGIVLWHFFLALQK